MKTTKKENIMAYVRHAVIEHITENEENIQVFSNKDIKEYINNVFYNEMLKYNNMYKSGKISRFNLFKDWIMGLCFISPMAEDLTPFTRYKKDYIQQEHDVLNSLINLYYINDINYFNKVILQYNNL